MAMIQASSANRGEFFNGLLGLQIEGLVWREMRDFTPGAVLAVLADRPYDESDYIRNYDEFVRICGFTPKLTASA